MSARPPAGRGRSRFLRVSVGALWACVMGSSIPTAVAGQIAEADPFPRLAPPTPISLAPSILSESRPTWQAPVAGALVPGLGQLLQGQRRGWLYLGVEGLVWLGYAIERDRGAQDRRGYRDLAWSEARLQSGGRVDGDFEYYERLSQWVRSGAFDADGGTPGVQPETDPATFNGDAWRLARNIFAGGGDPDPQSLEYASALAFYQERAYGEGFLWDWSSAEGQQARFRDLISSSDDHFRRASLLVGGAILNRAVSALDGALSARAGRPVALRLHPDALGDFGSGRPPTLALILTIR